MLAPLSFLVWFEAGKAVFRSAWCGVAVVGAQVALLGCAFVLSCLLNLFALVVIVAACLGLYLRGGLDDEVAPLREKHHSRIDVAELRRQAKGGVRHRRWPRPAHGRRSARLAM